MGAWALATIGLIPLANDAALLIGVTPEPLRHWAVAFSVPFLVLLPVTAAMGATLSTVDRVFLKVGQDRRSLGFLYAANTLGAMTGTLAVTLRHSAWDWVPAFGCRARRRELPLSALALASIPASVPAPAASDDAFAETPSAFRGRTLLFATGLLGIAYEVLCIRVLGQVLENTVYTFASALSVYLLGTAVGASLYHSFRQRVMSFERVQIRLLAGLSFTCALGLVVMSGSSSIYNWLAGKLGGGVSDRSRAKWFSPRVSLSCPRW